MLTPSATASENTRLWLWAGVVFTLLFVGLTLFQHPDFPVFTPYGAVLPYWLPLCGLLPVFFLLYGRLRVWAGVWLVGVFPPLLLFNANLLRPDVYFLFLCLAAGVLSTDREQFRFGLRMILAGMYLWTGVHKINPDFFSLTPPFLQDRLFNGVLSLAVVEAGVAVFPFVELAVGTLCLLPFAKPRAIAGMVLHTGILAMLLLGGWNRSMLPWNLLLLLCHVCLWNDRSRYTFQNLKAAAVPALLAVLMPALYLAGAWPVFASWTMYSARVESYYVAIPESVALHAPPMVQNYLYSYQDTSYYVGLTQWADAETGGAPCSEPWLKPLVFRQTRAYLVNVE